MADAEHDVVDVGSTCWLSIDGVDAQKWIARPELAEYSFWTINRHDGTAWLNGPNKGH